MEVCMKENGSKIRSMDLEYQDLRRDSIMKALLPGVKSKDLELNILRTAICTKVNTHRVSLRARANTYGKTALNTRVSSVVASVTVKEYGGRRMSKAHKYMKGAM
jgi:hypothetical protein